MLTYLWCVDLPVCVAGLPVGVLYLPVGVLTYLWCVDLPVGVLYLPVCVVGLPVGGQQGGGGVDEGAGGDVGDVGSVREHQVCAARLRHTTTQDVSRQRCVVCTFTCLCRLGCGLVL